MIQEDKELLLQYLSAALPYGVIVSCAEGTVMGVHWNKVKLDASLLFEFQNNDALSNVKPYLRQMSSMSEEEYEEYRNIDNLSYSCPIDYAHIPARDRIAWLLKNHFDYRGLIEKGLSIKVTKENNPYEN